MEFWQYAIENAFRLVLTPLGIVGLFLAIVWGSMAVYNQTLRWIALAAAVVVVSMAPALTVAELVRVIAIPEPLETIRQNSRLLYAMALLVTLPAVLFVKPTRGQSPIPAAGLALVVMQLVGAVSYGVREDPVRGLLEIITIAMLFVIIIVGVRRWCDSDPDAPHRMLIALGWAGAVFLAINVFVQVVARDASMVPFVNRMKGVTANPQMLGSACALFVPLLIYSLILHKRNPVVVAIFATALAMVAVLIALTGSRTAALMVVVSLFLFFRLRVFSFASVGILAGGLLFFLMPLFTGADASAARLISLENNRSHVWQAFIREFLDNPLFGVGRANLTASENSYLYIAASHGLLGVIPLIVGFALTVLATLRLIAIRYADNRERWQISVVVASLAAMSIAFMFDGYLMGMFNLPVLLLYIYLALSSSFLWRAMTASQAGSYMFGSSEPDYTSVDMDQPDELYVGR